MPNDPLQSFDIHRYLLQVLTSGLLWLIDTKIAGASEAAQAADAECDYFRRIRATIAPFAPSLAVAAAEDDDGDEDDEDAADADPETNTTAAKAALDALARTALDALADGDMLAFVRAAMAYDPRITFGDNHSVSTTARPEPRAPAADPAPATSSSPA
jgi:hypothetical protein